MGMSLPKSMRATVTPGVGVKLPAGLSAGVEDIAPLLAAVAEFGESIREHRFHPVRRWRFDVAWPGLMVALEREGSSWTQGRHTRGKGYRSDCEKYNAAQTLGWLVVRVTADMIRDGSAMRDLIAALQARRPAPIPPADGNYRGG